MEETGNTLNLSNRKLKKLNKPSPSESQVTILILDDNELQRLDNIDSFTKLEKLSAVRNQLLRMYGVCRLHFLHTLNLSYNGILTIEGLKELISLKWLCLAGNNIKTIEHLNTNVHLEHLDLSENSITHITDISVLKNLKELYLHKNKINHLSNCDRFLPVSLTILTLANNNIGDLNEVSRLVNLVNLTKISIANNPCVNMTGSNIGFDYRPFIINWCLNVKVIDDYVVDAIESLRAEWLYSQGRGRHYRIGDQKELTQYLATVCPLTGETLETEEDRKLRLILSKAQHHQQQLREQSTTVTPNPSPLTKKKMNPNRQSPRLNSSRLSNRFNKSPDRMSSSYYSTTSENTNNSFMSQSLDPTILRQSITPRSSNDSNNFVISEKRLDSEPVNSPLQALSKMVPVPESLMSPDYRPSNMIGGTAKGTPVRSNSPVRNSLENKSLLHKINQPMRSPKPTHNATNRTRNQLNQDFKNCRSPSPARQTGVNSTLHQESNKKPSIIRKKSFTSDDESEICDSKLQTIQMKAEERRLQKEQTINSLDKVQQAAICIQRRWRGYYTRNKDKDVRELFKGLESQRANQYIMKLAMDMESTKAALESERKIQMLQTEAISALWKKITALQANDTESSSSRNINVANLPMQNAEVVKGLAQTCTVLQTQIQQLQSSMQDIVKVMSVFSQTAELNYQIKENGIATQTEIIAVHTPQGEAAKLFPFQKHQPQSRPSSLPLPINQKKKESNCQITQQDVNSDLCQFVGNLVDGVIKTVSETKNDSLSYDTSEISVSDATHKNDISFNSSESKT